MPLKVARESEQPRGQEAHQQLGLASSNSLGGIMFAEGG